MKKKAKVGAGRGEPGGSPIPAPVPLASSPPHPLTPSPPHAVSSRFVRPLRVALALLLAVGVVAGIGWAGRRAGLGLIGRDRYAVRVADLDCPAPPGTDRATFLIEVRYLGNLPEQVSAVDPDLPARLRAAFGQHPWVEAVDAVAVGPGLAVTVRPRFRTPVLAVAIRGAPDRVAVDAAGVRLPPTAPTAGLAELAPAVPPPTRPAGEVWPDPDVIRGAELAGQHAATRVEKTAAGWRLTGQGGKVLRIER